MTYTFNNQEVSNNSNQKLVEFLIENSNRYVVVEFNDGYEEFTGVYKEAGEDYSFRRLIKIDISDKALKSFYLPDEDDDLYSELLLYNQYFNMTTPEFINEFTGDEGLDAEEFLKHSENLYQLSL